jgi:ABC-type oligopeptide transport system ATPase subunit
MCGGNTAIAIARRQSPVRLLGDVMQPALELRNLCKDFTIRTGGTFAAQLETVAAVQNVNLVLPANKIVAVVGESGSGKTTTGLLALRLTEPTSGQIFLHGTDVTKLDHAALKPFRRSMQVVFQDSYSALNPMMTLAQTVAEPLFIHGIGTASEQRTSALEWLERVGLHRNYGQRQRVAIARALILKPTVLIADEPTSALDVSVKAQIINLLLDLQRDMGLAIMFISHDLSVVRSLADSVTVMFNGRVVEQADTETIFSSARHPYTRSLLDAIPVRNPRQRRIRTFMSRDEIASAIPRLSQSDIGTAVEPSTHPRLVQINQSHSVEAIVTV